MPWDEREKNRGTQWRGNVNSRSRNEGIQEQQISYPVAKTANHSWKNGRSSGSCVKWSECKPPSCKNIKEWKPVLYYGSQLDERNLPERDAVRTKRLRKCWIKQLPKHYFRIFRLIFSNSLPPRVLWVRSLLLLPANAFFRYCPGVQPLCWRNCLQKCYTLL